ncbi:uncharacterized protein CTRU02_203026 [Colletotrichum truncatum]|uniref:Uncharacterized protein n=1 Tax=Colletotrichum truncatum TaxID=5467 RepID=A0ACC3Z847_COLTU|nr:uncharacterized protein CTRU02_13153 [Colletotrichum truncatum]KAF6783645.1 hypothetical protein CTRU02_13153 [Colletotrichum truncatum]
MAPPKSPERPTPRSLVAVGFLLLYPFASAATTTGALARVSIYSELAYSTARACAAGCLVYNGQYPCGLVGYQDLGVALQCGCASINGCYCNTALASSATSYISSCVSKGCSRVDNWSVDMSSMLNLYDSYCATANGGVADAPATTTGAGSSPTTAGGAKGQSNGQATRTPAPGSSGTSSADAQQSSAAPDNGGLSRSDIVALAASLGVGIPSLLIAGLTLYFQMKKKRRNAAAGENEASSMQSMVHVAPPPNPYGVSVYESSPSPAPHAWR